MTPVLDLTSELDAVRAPQPPKLDLEAELRAVQPVASPQREFLPGYAAPGLTEEQLTTAGTQTAHGFRVALAALGGPQTADVTDNEVRNARLQMLLLSGGPQGMAFKGAEPAIEVAGRYASQALGRIGQAAGGLLGRAPAVAPEAERVLPEVQPALSAVERPAAALPAQPAPVLDLAKELNAVRTAAPSAPAASPTVPSVAPRVAASRLNEATLARTPPLPRPPAPLAAGPTEPHCLPRPFLRG